MQFAHVVLRNCGVSAEATLCRHVCSFDPADLRSRRMSHGIGSPCDAGKAWKSNWRTWRTLGNPTWQRNESMQIIYTSSTQSTHVGFSIAMLDYKREICNVCNGQWTFSGELRNMGCTGCFTGPTKSSTKCLQSSEKPWMFHDVSWPSLKKSL